MKLFGQKVPKKATHYRKSAEGVTFYRHNKLANVMFRYKEGESRWVVSEIAPGSTGFIPIVRDEKSVNDTVVGLQKLNQKIKANLNSLYGQKASEKPRIRLVAVSTPLTVTEIQGRRDKIERKFSLVDFMLGDFADAIIHVTSPFTSDQAEDRTTVRVGLPTASWKSLYSTRPKAKEATVIRANKASRLLYLDSKIRDVRLEMNRLKQVTEPVRLFHLTVGDRFMVVEESLDRGKREAYCGKLFRIEVTVGRNPQYTSGGTGLYGKPYRMKLVDEDSGDSFEMPHLSTMVWKC